MRSSSRGPAPASTAAGSYRPLAIPGSGLSPEERAECVVSAERIRTLSARSLWSEAVLGLHVPHDEPALQLVKQRVRFAVGAEDVGSVQARIARSTAPVAYHAPVVGDQTSVW